MKYEPFFYQQEAERFILERPASALFLDMGMGKTVITLTAVEKLLYLGEAKKVLVIAPLRPALETWPSEICKWDHLSKLSCSLILGSQRSRFQALEHSADIYIVNRENVAWLVDYFKTRWPFDTVVIDELSSFKSNSAVRFKALRKVRKYIDRIIGLTGTPAPNGLLDLWPQIFLLDQGTALGKTLGAYRNAYFLPGKRGPQGVVYSWDPQPGAEEQIYKKLEPLCLSMKSADYLHLPKRIFVRKEIELSEQTQKQYSQLEKDYLLPFADGDVDAGTAAILANKLLQVASGTVYDENGTVKLIHDEKIQALELIIEEANGQSVVIFYTYRHEADRIKEHFPDAVDIRSENAVADWNNGKIPILLAHPASAGHGLNLQEGGHIAVWFSPTWSLELYNQANKRLHRVGQKEPVIIFHLIAKNTIDSRVLDIVLKQKERTQEALIDALKARIKEVV